ncbi:MAG: hypothetical protein M1491_04080 [Deltaproteobacteria bacterium]|nr:hypothetical protein [Deltaproteobacteria bacterium]
MDKKMIFLFSGLLMGFVLIINGCGQSNSGGSASGQNSKVIGLLQQGSNALLNNDPSTARSSCQAALNLDKNNCNAQWCLILADVQDVVGNQGTTVVTNLITGLLNDDIADSFSGLTADLTDIASRTPVVEANSCEFTLSTLSLEFHPDLSIASSYSQKSIDIKVALGTQWGPAEARVLGSTANSMMAFIDTLSAHSYDAACVVRWVGSNYNSPAIANFKEDPLGAIRFAGGLLAQCKDFLAFTDRAPKPGAYYLSRVGSDMASAIKEARGLPDALVKDSGNPQKVLAYTDVNNDGVVDALDTFKLGCTDETSGKSCVSRWSSGDPQATSMFVSPDGTITVPFFVNNKIVPAIQSLMGMVEGNLASEDPAQLKPTDLNVLIDAVVPSLELKTNVIAADPYRLFSDPQPLRNYYPTLNPADEFQVEAEVAPANTVGLPWYYRSGDTGHFTDGTSPIVSDGITAPQYTFSDQGCDVTMPAMIPYVSFGDPSFNGALSVDLSQMLEFCEPQGSADGTPAASCPASATENFVPATRYNLNKIIAGAAYGAYTYITGTKPTMPVW